MPTWSSMPRRVGRATPTESRAQSTPVEDLDIDEFDLRSNNSLSFWYDDVENAGESFYDESIWMCAKCGSDRFVWNAPVGNVFMGFWTCAMCSSTDFFDSNQPAKHQTDKGTWVFVPTGGGGTCNPPSSKVPQPRNRHRRRRRHGPPPFEPDDAGDDPGEGAESEIRTNDPTVDATPAGSMQHQRRHGQPGQDNRRLDGQAGGNQQADQIEALATAIQRLADNRRNETASSSDSWISAMGPQKGVRWRSGAPPQPPSWTYNSSDLRAYEKFERKVKIWELHAKHFMTEAEVALTLYTSLKGEAEQELEFVDINTIYKRGGVDTILSLLRQAFQQKTVYIKRQYLHDYEAIGRWPNESLRTYVNRYRRAEQSLLAVGVNVGLTYDDESRGSRLLDRARLTQEQQRLIFVGSGQSLSFDAIKAALMLQFPEHKAAPPVAGRDSTTAPYQKGAGKSSGATSSSSPNTSSTSGYQGKAKAKTKDLAEFLLLRLKRIPFLKKELKMMEMPKQMKIMENRRMQRLLTTPMVRTMNLIRTMMRA